MPLPNAIYIEPLDHPISADDQPLEITVPGSKSITNRALILAALGNGKTILRGALWSEDTEVMVQALMKLGFQISEPEIDPAEACNRTLRIEGLGGRIPNGGSKNSPLELHVANAGTAARFLTALVCLGEGYFRLSGVARMHERPQAALFAALRSLGYEVFSEHQNDRMPVIVRGGGRLTEKRKCVVGQEESSQFASALQLCAETGNWEILPQNPKLAESPYLAMTRELIKVFKKCPSEFQIEPDASSGSYFWGAGHLLSEDLRGPTTHAAFPVRVKHWPSSGWQIDSEFPKFLPLPEIVSRQHDLGDSIMTAIVMAPFEKHATEFTDLGRLRVQECDRVMALHDELRKCGVAAKTNTTGENLWIEPAPEGLKPASIETYNDHRMAMCFGMLSLVSPGLIINNPACVKKTFPNFFQKLAASAPSGFGARIRDAATGAVLTSEELFAD